MDYIHTYTRKQAIEDGALIDISNVAKGRGFRHPVAITSSIWHEYIVPCETLKYIGQSIQGRLWDMLSFLYEKIAESPANDFLLFDTFFAMADGWHDYIHKCIRLKAVAGAGDDGEPVITIMFPSED